MLLIDEDRKPYSSVTPEGSPQQDQEPEPSHQRQEPEVGSEDLPLSVGCACNTL